MTLVCGNFVCPIQRTDGHIAEIEDPVRCNAMARRYDQQYKEICTL